MIKMATAAALMVTIGAGVLATHAIGQTPDRAGATGETHPGDVIFARRVLMGEIELYMQDIESVVHESVHTGEAVDFEAAESADIASVMLLAFPQLFPPGTDFWSAEAEAEDPTSVTLALPAVWENFPDFYARANEFAQEAFDLSRMTPRDQAWRERAGDLRSACNSCHAEYTRLPPPGTRLPPPEVTR